MSLEVTYRKGKPVAAYLYLARRAGDRAVRSEPHNDGLVVDYAADDRPIGIEITSPTKLSWPAINRLLTSLNQPLATMADLEPLTIAG